jgi:hypothetical protein
LTFFFSHFSAEQSLLVIRLYNTIICLRFPTYRAMECWKQNIETHEHWNDWIRTKCKKNYCRNCNILSEFLARRPMTTHRRQPDRCRHNYLRKVVPM